MIKRSDLAKQFELVVQQEIINHNKAISENNLKFNEIQKEIAALKVEDCKNSERFVAKFNTLTCQLNDTISYYQRELKALENKSNDRDCLSKRKNEDALQSVSQIRYQLNSLNKVEEKTRELFLKYSELERLFTDLYSKTHSKIESLERQYIRFLDLNKEVIRANTEKELLKLETKLNKRLDVNSVNIDCNGQKIDKLQRETYIMKKHIERLETHLKRLEGKA